MKIIRAKKMGFCFGVAKAVDMAHELLTQFPNRPIYILGMLVHNPVVIQDLISRGIHFISEKDLTTLPEDALLIIRAHGVTQETYQALRHKDITTYDATCIFVKKARDLIIEKEKEGFHILFIGDKNHPEVQGIVSHVSTVSLFDSLEALETLFIPEIDKRYFVLSQTTYNLKKFQEIKTYCETHYQNVTVADTICYATHERQEAIVELAHSCDKVIVVGGKNSSNTVKLYQLAHQINSSTIHIETVDELDLSLFTPHDTIGITAGASTPEISIVSIENTLKEAFVNTQDFETLLNEYSLAHQRGEIVTGTIIHKDNNYALIEIPGIKGQGKINSSELEGYQVGSHVEVKILSTHEDFYGNIAVSRAAIERDLAYNALQNALTQHTPIEAIVSQVNESGYQLSYQGFTLFLPKSLSPQREVALEESITVIIKEIKTPKNIIASHKEYAQQQAKIAFQERHIGEELTCTIHKISPIGLMVHYETLSGFIHISEIAWNRVENLETLFAEGETLRAKIISLDQDKLSIKLSIKQLSVDPWITFTEKFSVGDVVEASVNEIKPFGAILSLEAGIRGFLHKTELSWDRHLKSVEHYAPLHSTLRVQITEIEFDKRSVKLSLKNTQTNPWLGIEDRFPIHSTLQGRLTHRYDYGLFVEVEPGIEFFIYKNEISWIAAAAPTLHLGDLIAFKVIEIDLEKNQLKGSIKQLEENPYRSFMNQHALNSSVTAPIIEILNDGIKVDLGAHRIGFIPRTELAEKLPENLSSLYQLGESITGIITDIDLKRHRIILSALKFTHAQERQELDEMLKKYGV